MPQCIDLYCGLGGWAEGFLSEGWDVIGFDNHRHAYGEHRYPGQLVLRDALTLHGSQFRKADCIVASPPCQKYSYMAMPWGRSKREVRWQEWERDSPFGDRLESLNALFAACFRIQREASAAAGRHIPMVVENVKGAQPWIGRAAWHFGSFYLWGDVPAIMPRTLKLRKVPGFNFHQHENGGTGGSFQSVAVEQVRSGTKNEGTAGGSWFNIAHGKEIPGNQAGAPNRGDGLKAREGTKCPGNDTFRETGQPCGKLTDPRYPSGGTKHGGDWFSGYGGGFGGDHSQMRQHSSKSPARKAASAMIAKIPFELSSYIARYYRP